MSWILGEGPTCLGVGVQWWYFRIPLGFMNLIEVGLGFDIGFREKGKDKSRCGKVGISSGTRKFVLLQA